MRVLVVWGEHVSCCLAEAVNEVASSGVWIRSLLPPLCDPSLACAGPPLQLSFILLILSGVMKMDQMKTQKHPLCPQPAPADWRQQVRARSGDYLKTQNARGLTHAEKKNSTQMGPTKRKCCLTPAPCGHAPAQIASKELDASWLSYVLGKWKGFHPYLNHYAAVVELFFSQRSGLHRGQSKTTIKITTVLMKATKHGCFPSFVMHSVDRHKKREFDLNHIEMSNEICSKWIFVLHYMPEQTQG